MVDALDGLSGDLAGKYYPLNGMSEAEQEAMIKVATSSSVCRVCVCLLNSPCFWNQLPVFCSFSSDFQTILPCCDGEN